MVPGSAVDAKVLTGRIPFSADNDRRGRRVPEQLPVCVLSAPACATRQRRSPQFASLMGELARVTASSHIKPARATNFRLPRWVSNPAAAGVQATVADAALYVANGGFGGGKIFGKDHFGSSWLRTIGRAFTQISVRA